MAAAKRTKKSSRNSRNIGMPRTNKSRSMLVSMVVCGEIGCQHPGLSPHQPIPILLQSRQQALQNPRRDHAQIGYHGFPDKSGRVLQTLQNDGGRQTPTLLPGDVKAAGQRPIR
jgi:hypothetical protein